MQQKNIVSEEKIISLDYGNNLSRFEIALDVTDTISARLSLHENDGEIQVEEKDGWLIYWVSHGDSELGMGIVVPVVYEHYISNRKDESNLYAHIKAFNGTVVCYAGFGWKKSDQFATEREWAPYLKDFAEQLENPLQVVVQ